jgi:5-formyltetrahydrofolate cyclo-ligase
MPQGEISTTGIVRDALAAGKEVFVPYTHNIETESTQSTVSVMDMLRLDSMEEFESLTPDKWGIPSLSAASVSSRSNCFGGLGVVKDRFRGPGQDLGLDLIVMPGMAFDTDMRRLGHGKGYYDHFLNRYSREVEGSPRACRRPFLGKDFLYPPLRIADQYHLMAVALALKEQIVLPPEEIPVTDHDHPIDAVIVGDGGLITSGS